MTAKIISIVIKEGKQLVELEFPEIIKPDTMPLETLTVGQKYEITFIEHNQTPEFNE